MVRSKNMFLQVALISCVVKKIKELNASKQIGKTFLQKIMYCITREKLANFSYTMYHYGPYSAELSRELNFAVNNNYLEILWTDSRGYDIHTTSKTDTLEKLISGKQKQRINDIIIKYINFSPVELSLLTTAYFLQDEYKVKTNNLVESVHELKPEYGIDFISSIIDKATAGEISD